MLNRYIHPMNTYAIERVNGQFEVAMYERKWFRTRRHLVQACDRLMTAEQLLLGVVGEAYTRKLDRDRFAPVQVTIADCEPRVSEEHIYTAVVLQGGDMPRRGELVSPIFETAEKMVGAKLSNVERRLFIHRFMTWYARHNPEYDDPRLESIPEYGHGVPDPYAASVSGPTVRTGVMRRLIDAMSGRGI